MLSPTPTPPSNNTVTAYTAVSWREFFDTNTISVPDTFSKILTRLNKNLPYFKVNYTILGLMIIPILSLLRNVTLTTLLVSAALLAVLYYYFSARLAETPFGVFGFIVNDKTVVGTLLVANIFCIIFLSSGREFGVTLLEYMVMVCLYGGLKDARADGDVGDSYGRLLGGGAGAGGANYNTMQQP